MACQSRESTKTKTNTKTSAKIKTKGKSHHSGTEFAELR